MASRGLRCICLTYTDFDAVDPSRAPDFFSNPDGVDANLVAQAIVGIKDPVRCAGMGFGRGGDIWDSGGGGRQGGWGGLAVEVRGRDGGGGRGKGERAGQAASWPLGLLGRT
jgi:hypothetical protein